MAKHLTPAQCRRLVVLSFKLSRALKELDTPQSRDAVTGAFKVGSSVTGAKLRAAWGLPGRGASRGGSPLKSQLLAAIRARRATPVKL
ncbi:MAG: hypothetical protein ABIR80_10300 [Opitutaceae bacterium]